MATTQNGSQVIESGRDPRLVRNPIPGTNGAIYVGGLLAGDIDIIGRYIGWWWHHNIEPLDPKSLWGWALRFVRGQTEDYSNHAAGEAGDCNASQHPLGTRTLGAVKLAKLRRLSEILGGSIRFGAFYTGRPDEMHWERVGSAFLVKTIADDIRQGTIPDPCPELMTRIPGGTPNPVPAPTPKPVPVPVDDGDDDMARTRRWFVLWDNRIGYRTLDGDGFVLPFQQSGMAGVRKRLELAKADGETSVVWNPGDNTYAPLTSTDQLGKVGKVPAEWLYLLGRDLT